MKGSHVVQNTYESLDVHFGQCLQVFDIGSQLIKSPFSLHAVQLKPFLLEMAAPSAGWWLGLLQQGSMGIALRERERDFQRKKNSEVKCIKQISTLLRVEIQLSSGIFFFFFLPKTLHQSQPQPYQQMWHESRLLKSQVSSGSLS